MKRLFKQIKYSNWIPAKPFAGLIEPMLSLQIGSLGTTTMALGASEWILVKLLALQ